jgi:hypothetical protein
MEVTAHGAPLGKYEQLTVRLVSCFTLYRINQAFATFISDPQEL